MECQRLVNEIYGWDGEVCLFGAGECGITWGYDLCIKMGLNIAFYCDNNCAGVIKNGLKVYSADYLEDKVDDILVIIPVYGISGLQIKLQLEDMGVKNIFWLCDSDDEPENELLDYLEKNNEFELIEKLQPVIGDEAYIHRWYKKRFGEEVNLDEPITYNEKIQWLKLHDRKEIYTKLVDKYAVKEYIKNLIGGNYIIPTIGVYSNFSEIDFSKLPERFVIKCTHDSGSIIVCLDKDKLDMDQLDSYFSSKLLKNAYYQGREWSYKNVKPRIIVEEYIEELGESLKDYKVHCFNGEPTFIQVIGDRDLQNHTAKQLIYNFDWDLQAWSFGDYPRYSIPLKKPERLKELYDVCKALCRDMIYVRLDFYICDKGVKFGEFTFYPLNGCYERNEEWTFAVDKMLGDLIKI